jgi:hypothetical protein
MKKNAIEAWPDCRVTEFPDDFTALADYGRIAFNKVISGEVLNLPIQERRQFMLDLGRLAWFQSRAISSLVNREFGLNPPQLIIKSVGDGALREIEAIGSQNDVGATMGATTNT